MKQHQQACGGAESVLNMEANSSIDIAYHSLFGSHDELVLFEVDEKLIPDFLNQRVILRGQPDEDVVLCTRSKTYAIKFVETSNSVLLIPPSSQFGMDGGGSGDFCHKENCDEQVVAPVLKVASGNMELLEVAPRLDKLKLLLSQAPYVDEEEMLDRSRVYTWDDLVNKVQASDEELRTGLQALSAVEIEGYWRIVDEKYMDLILSMLLHNSVINDWSFYALNEDEVVSALNSDGFPPELARHFLCVYGTRVNEDIDSSCIWKLDEKRVCVHFARQILKAGKMKMDSFIRQWRQKIPDGMRACFDMLEGEVLTEKYGTETWVYVFSVSSLPLNPAERFSILFKERSKWEWKDLQHYIRDLSVPRLSSEGLLLKYTRRTQASTDAEPIFTAR